MATRGKAIFICARIAEMLSRLRAPVGRQVRGVLPAGQNSGSRSCAGSGGMRSPSPVASGLGTRGWGWREGRAAPPEAANCGERRPFEVLRVQGNGGGLLSAPIQRCFICSEPRRPWVSPRKSVQWPLWSLYLTLRVLRISKFLLDRKKKQEASFCGPGKCRAG